MGRISVLFCAIVFLLATALGCANSQATVSAAPQSIAGFKQVKLVTGQDAINGMSELHGKDVGITAGWIGYYEGRAVIWTAQAKGENEAIQLLNAMEQRIGAGNQIFTNLQKLQIDGTAVYTVIGMGQKHFFYQKGDKVIWIAAPNGAEDTFFRQALMAIK